MKGESISAVCLKKYVEIAVSCLGENGVERPSTKHVVGGLEFALELQESAERVIDIGCGLEITAVKPPVGHDLFCSESGSGKLEGDNSSNTTVFNSGGGRLTSDSE